MATSCQQTAPGSLATCAPRKLPACHIANAALRVGGERCLAATADLRGWAQLRTAAGGTRHRPDDSMTKAIDRILRTDLIIIDLCRTWNYTDPASAGGSAILAAVGSARSRPRQGSA